MRKVIKKQAMKNLINLLFIIIVQLSYSQNLDKLDSYTVDEFYKKIDLDSGTLGEDGRAIDFIFIKTELDKGTYEIKLTDGPGDLYEVIDTNIFIEFRNYFGYAGYRKECILKVNSPYSSTVYKLE